MEVRAGMRSINGKYQLEDASTAAFFGTRTINLIVRETGVTGRFGREGFIQGTISGQDFVGDWHDRTRRGWMRVRFARGFRTGLFEYGTNSELLGSSAIVKRLRPSRSHRSDTPAAN